MLEELLADPYFDRPPPKSTGHEHFGSEFFERARERLVDAGGGPDDLLATLSALTVESVVRCASRFLPGTIERWIVYGGGTHNRAMLEGLKRRLAPAPIDPADVHGFPGDALEAMAFALLGWASSHSLPSNLPGATGARRRVVLGSSTPPASFG